MTTLNPKQWFEYSIDQPLPSKVKIFEGECYKRKYIATITRMQALSLIRWHGHRGIYWGKKDGNGRWVDVRVVGDIEAWLGNDYLNEDEL